LDTAAPKCVNCHGEHPANSTSCKNYIEYKKRIENLKTQKKNLIQGPQPRNFVSTPAPWSCKNNVINYNQNFPPLNNLNSNMSASNYVESSDFNSLQQRFNSIPNIDQTMNLYKEMIDKLEKTNCHYTRLDIIMQFTVPK
jgi:hypothetical protein